MNASSPALTEQPTANPLLAMQRATLEMEARRQRAAMGQLMTQLVEAQKDLMQDMMGKVAQASAAETVQALNAVAAELRILREAERPQASLPDAGTVANAVVSRMETVLAASRDADSNLLREATLANVRPARRMASGIQLLLVMMTLLLAVAGTTAVWWWKSGAPRFAPLETEKISQARAELVSMQAALEAKQGELSRLTQEASQLSQTVAQSAQAAQVASQTLTVLRTEMQRFQKMQESVRPLLMQGEDGKTYIAVEKETMPIVHAGKSFYPVAQ